MLQWISTMLHAVFHETICVAENTCAIVSGLEVERDSGFTLMFDFRGREVERQVGVAGLEVSLLWLRRESDEAS